MKKQITGGRLAPRTTPRIVQVNGRYTVDEDMVVVRIAADTSTLPPINADLNDTRLLKDVKTSLFTPSGSGNLGYLDTPPLLLKRGDVITTDGSFLMYGKTHSDVVVSHMYIHGFSITPSQPSEALTVPRERFYILDEVRLKEDGSGSLPDSFTLYVDGAPIITAPIQAFHPHIYPNLGVSVIARRSISLVPNGKFTATVRGLFVFTIGKV